MHAYDFWGNRFDIEAFANAGYDVDRMRKFGSESWADRARDKLHKSILNMTTEEIASIPLLEGENIWQD